MRAPTDRHEKDPQVEPVRVEPITLVILVAALLISFANLSVALTPSPAFCRVCHGGEYRALERTSHADVRCSDCHSESSVLGLLTARIQTARMVTSYVTGLYERPVTATVPAGACRACHAQVERRTIVSKGLRVSHKEMREVTQCTSCHSTVAHGKLVPSPDRTAMGKCTACHDGRKASADCSVCHPAGTMLAERVRSSWQVTHGRDWRKLHGAGNLKDCGVCHNPNFCTRCHGMILPHPDFWPNLHGPSAKPAPDKCFQCHSARLCDNCHQVKMPHPSSFLAEHAAVTRRLGEAKCFKCHLDQGCDKCHALHIHPGLSSDAAKRMRREAGLD